MDSVCVLLSTYNGEKFLSLQLKSIENAATGFKVQYYVRDDGSIDRTVAMLEKWKETHDVAIERGRNIGVKNSFLWLFAHAPIADFYALADQDDEWTAEKLTRATKRLRPSGNMPCLYYSAQEEIDEDGNSQGIIRASINPAMTFENSFVYNFAPGCAQVFNRALMQEIQKYNVEKCVMHDMVTVQLAGIFGEIIYDEKPTIRYRQHSQNVTTAVNNPAKKFHQHWYVWAKASGCPLSVQAQEYIEKVGEDMPPEKRDFLIVLRDYKKNIRLWHKLWRGYVSASGGWKRNKSFRIRVFLRLA